MPPRRKVKPPEPTLDDYFTRATALAKLVRKRLDGHKVTRGEMRKVLEAFEAVDYGAM